MGLDLRLLPFKLEDAEMDEVIFPLCFLPVERDQELYCFVDGSDFERAPGDWIFDGVEHTLPGQVEKTLFYAKPESFREFDITNWSPLDRAAVCYIRELGDEYRVLIDWG